jgi:squalene-hopene/tetraprenyl-beta-curcumene cyclase
MLDLVRLRAAYQQTRDELLAERTPEGHWVGELSSSALATATAVSALAVVRRGQRSEVRGQEDLDELVRRGVAYLVRQQNEDGGFGDTDLSHSNIATTMLVVAALHLAGATHEHGELLARANAYIDSHGRMDGLRKRYGIDKTFVVPIMTNLALAGLVEWREIDPLPFELACVPQALYRFVGMPVVSYAIPALVAIGQAHFHHAPPRNPITRLIRKLSIQRSLSVLRRMQPDSGGYLEATPLTSFVVMSLASCYRSPHAPREEPTARSINASKGEGHITRSVMATVADEVIREGIKFLASSIRHDGSWPIDTNLATWNTTLAINALAGAGEDVAELLGPKCLDWLLSCQHNKRHPFTGADPGGFGWSDLSGAVPDADDTPGAMIAIDEWAVSLIDQGSEEAWESLCHQRGIAQQWLEGLQNRDGGWPTFCRGWGKLPFDRSGVDLTAHAIRAINGPVLSNEQLANISSVKHTAQAIASGFHFIKSEQHPGGSWSPLWFGNQDHPNEDNPVYGTAKVLMAYRDLGLMDSPEAQRGVAWLVARQNDDGGWGSGVWAKAESGKRKAELAEHTPPSPNPRDPSPLLSSIEETAHAVEALLAATPTPDSRLPTPEVAAVETGLNWLIERVERGEHRQPAPIGFYFAKLWYYERLYPLTFTVAALGRACRQFARTAPTASTDSHPAGPPNLARA